MKSLGMIKRSPLEEAEARASEIKGLLEELSIVSVLSVHQIEIGFKVDLGRDRLNVICSALRELEEVVEAMDEGEM